MLNTGSPMRVPVSTVKSLCVDFLAQFRDALDEVAGRRRFLEALHRFRHEVDFDRGHDHARNAVAIEQHGEKDDRQGQQEQAAGDSVPGLLTHLR